MKDGRAPEIQTLYETEGNLDDHGRMGSSFTIAETPVWYGRLTVESSVRDDRGKSVANRTSAACFGRDRYVGVLQQDWTLRQDRAARLRLVVIDREGAIVSGVPISVTSEYEKTWGATGQGGRRRLSDGIPAQLGDRAATAGSLGTGPPGTGIYPRPCGPAQADRRHQGQPGPSPQHGDRALGDRPRRRALGIHTRQSAQRLCRKERLHGRRDGPVFRAESLSGSQGADHRRTLRGDRTLDEDLCEQLGDHQDPGAAGLPAGILPVGDW